MSNLKPNQDVTEESVQQSPHSIDPSAGPRFTLSKKIGIVFLILALLGLGNILIVHTMFVQFSGYNQAMAMVGKLRFLSHRVALNTSSALNGWSPGQEAALSGIAQYEEALNMLMHRGSSNSDHIRQMKPPQLAILAELTRAWRPYREGIKSTLLGNRSSRPDTSQFVALTEGSERLQGYAEALMESLIAAISQEQKNDLKIGYLLLTVDILLLGVMWLIVRINFVHPLLRLTQGSRELANGNYQVHIEHRFNDEVGELADAFNYSAQRIGTLVGNLEQEHLNLLRAESMFRGVAETSAVGVYIVQDNQFVFVNAKVAQMLGVEQHTILELSMCDLIVEADHDRLKANAQKRLNGIEGMACEYQARRKDGSLFDVAIYSASMTLDGRPAIIGIAMDITDKKKIEELVWRQANFDSLTELPNRMMFHDRLEQEIHASARTGLPMALIFIDLDHFKKVNDTLGHAAGDLLLQQASRRLGRCVRDTDTVARLGGDEFTIILSGLTCPTNTDRIVQDVLKKMAAPFNLGDEMVYVSASIGITFYPNDASGSEALLKNADQAMYAAKDLGRNRYSYFSPRIQEEAQTQQRQLTPV